MYYKAQTALGKQLTSSSVGPHGHHMEEGWGTSVVCGLCVWGVGWGDVMAVWPNEKASWGWHPCFAIPVIFISRTSTGMLLG
jgi:hypothetical protein